MADARRCVTQCADEDRVDVALQDWRVVGWPVTVAAGVPAAAGVTAAAANSRQQAAQQATWAAGSKQWARVPLAADSFSLTNEE